MDDFSVKYVGNEHADHLIRALEKDYKLAEDWEGKIYCGTTLDWNYKEGYLNISMPNYIPTMIK